MGRLPMFSDPRRRARALDLVTTAEIIAMCRRAMPFCFECSLSLPFEACDAELIDGVRVLTHPVCGERCGFPEEV